VGSKLVELDEISETEKAKFIVSLVKQYNLVRERSTRIEQQRLEQIRLEREQEALRQQQAQIEKFLSVQKQINSSQKKKEKKGNTSRSNSSSPGVRYQYHRKE